MARPESGLQKSNRYRSGKGGRLTGRGSRAHAPGRVHGPKTGSHFRPDVVVGVKNALQSSHLSVDESPVKGDMEELRPVQLPSALRHYIIELGCCSSQGVNLETYNKE